MYIYTCTYIHIYIHTHKHIHICVSAHVQTHTYPVPHVHPVGQLPCKGENWGAERFPGGAKNPPQVSAHCTTLPPGLPPAFKALNQGQCEPGLQEKLHADTISHSQVFSSYTEPGISWSLKMQEGVFHSPLISSSRRCRINLELTSLNAISMQQKCISLKSQSFSLPLPLTFYLCLLSFLLTERNRWINEK